MIVTDNAKNMTNSCEKAELLHIGCAVHTLNLAVNRGLEVGEVSTLVGKCKKLVAVFKMSALKSHALMKAEEMLDIEKLQVLQDEETRWNSSLARNIEKGH